MTNFQIEVVLAALKVSKWKRLRFRRKGFITDTRILNRVVCLSVIVDGENY